MSRKKEQLVKVDTAHSVEFAMTLREATRQVLEAHVKAGHIIHAVCVVPNHHAMSYHGEGWVFYSEPEGQ